MVKMIKFDSNFGGNLGKVEVQMTEPINFGRVNISDHFESDVQAMVNEFCLIFDENWDVEMLRNLGVFALGYSAGQRRGICPTMPVKPTIEAGD